MDSKSKPLSELLRPKKCSEVVGCEDICGKNGIIKKAIEKKLLFSFILWGPPGSGKTTIAEIYIKSFNVPILKETGSSFSLKKTKEFLENARKLKNFNGTTSIVFIDEIHRLNKAQQDVFLQFIEEGSAVLVGTTTENPSFELNNALLSRVKVIILKSLSKENIKKIYLKAKELLEKEKSIKIDNDVFEVLYSSFGSDLRTILNTLSILVETEEKAIIKKEDLEKLISEEKYLYDKKGDYHYDLISALHKSIRNSDVDSSLYYLARMLIAGEDRKFILRRLIRIAAEDIGLSDPEALTIALNSFKAYEIIGSPEGEIFLFYTTIYLSLSPKSNSIYLAENNAIKAAKEFPDEEVPLHIRNPETSFTKKIGYGKGYLYAHNFPEKTTPMETIPEKLKGKTFYEPIDIGFEKELKKRYLYWKKLKEKLKKS